MPGENHKVVALACDMDNDKHSSLDGCKDIHILTSCVKQFFRDLKTPLIGQEVKEILIDSTCKFDDQEIIDVLREGVGRPGFVFGHLARDPHFDNVTRRHRYSRGPSGFCEWRRGGVIFYRFVLEEKGPFFEKTNR